MGTPKIKKKVTSLGLPSLDAFPTKPLPLGPQGYAAGLATPDYNQADYNRGSHTGNQYYANTVGQQNAPAVVVPQATPSLASAPITTSALKTTPYQTTFEGRNPEATLGVNGEWSGLSQKGIEAGDSYGALGNQQKGIWDNGLTGALQNKDLMSGLAGGMSALGTGFDIYDKMWGGGADVRDAQIRNANAQASYNEQATKHKKDFYSGMKTSGLAASGKGV